MGDSTQAMAPPREIAAQAPDPGSGRLPVMQQIGIRYLSSLMGFGGLAAGAKRPGVEARFGHV